MKVVEYQNDIMELKNKNKLDFIMCWEEEINGEPSVCCSKDNKTLQIIPKTEWKLNIEELTEYEDENDWALAKYYKDIEKYIPATLTEERQTRNISYTETPCDVTFAKIVSNNKDKHVWVNVDFLKYFENPTFMIKKIAPMLFSVGVHENDKLVGVVIPQRGL
jgi:hypothetical protein